MLPEPLSWLTRPGPVPRLDVSEPPGVELRVKAKAVQLAAVRAHKAAGPVWAWSPVARRRSNRGSAETGDRAQPEFKAGAMRLVALRSGLSHMRDRFQRFFAPPATRTQRQRSARQLVWLRRISQAFFLGLFVWLLVATTFRGAFDGSAAVRMRYPVEAFILADPYIAAITLLSTHSVYRGLAWSLGILALTLLVGRAFCGWICPFGTLHHVTAWLAPSRYIRSKRRVAINQTQGWQALKYYVLWGSLAAALVGSAIGGALDPMCVAVRSIGLSVMPLAQYAAAAFSFELAASNIGVVQRTGDWASDQLADAVFGPNPHHFHHAWFVLSTFVLVLALNRVVPRFWCRALCPLGGLLGVLSRFSLLGMEKQHEKCTDCNLCLLHCQGADNPQGGVKHEQAECHLCFNCVDACPEDVIRFRFLPTKRSRREKPSLSRRTTLATTAAAIVAIPGMRISNWPGGAYHPRVIRPPGAVEEKEFLERCIRCAECMKVCPNNALHPGFFEAGPEGLWAPILIPRVGYCEHSCVLCGQVCPTGAIAKIDEAAKLGLGRRPVSIGTAMFDHGRCLPWAMATPCIVCEEFCPTSPKAIWVEEVEVSKRSAIAPEDGASPAMERVTVKRPHVDPSLCIGCGACEHVCPVVDQPAVYVTSAGETRSRTNVILLENTRYTD